MSDARHNRHSTAPRGARGVCAALVLLALGWTQLALASHLFDHPVTAVDDSCSVCLQFDRVGDADVDSGEVAAQATAGVVPGTAVQQGRAVAHDLPVRQRAPPAA